MEEFGSIMKQERIKKGLSITELSKFTGVDIKTISFIERGLRRKPTLDKLFRLANVLECITFDMLKSIGYTENEIVTYLCDDDDEDEEDYEDLSEFEYNFHIALHGHGKVLARDIDEAYDNAEEIIRDHLKLNNYNSDCENMNFNKEYSILYDFGKDK
jgi:transcriptional regulator with XRE-family HTH domain